MGRVDRRRSAQTAYVAFHTSDFFMTKKAAALIKEQTALYVIFLLPLLAKSAANVWIVILELLVERNVI